MEMIIHAAEGGPAGAEGTIRSPQKGTIRSAKFSGVDSSNPSERCAADQGSPCNQLSDHGVDMSMAFSSSMANQQMMQRAAHFTESHSDRTSARSRNGAAQLTIFYGGMVHVYDVPADKAKAIMALASSANNIRNPQVMRDSVSIGHHHARPSTAVGSTEMPKQLAIAGTFPASYNQCQSIRPDQLPLSRKLSLQRFLEKRKERANSIRLCNYAPVKPRICSS